MKYIKLFEEMSQQEANNLWKDDLLKIRDLFSPLSEKYGLIEDEFFEAKHDSIFNIGLVDEDTLMITVTFTYPTKVNSFMKDFDELKIKVQEVNNFNVMIDKDITKQKRPEGTKGILPPITSIFMSITMKYLKFFNESINNIDEIIQTCKDILVDLRDMDFITEVYQHENILMVVIMKNKTFNYSEIKEDFESVESYLSTMNIFPNERYGKTYFDGVNDFIQEYKLY